MCLMQEGITPLYSASRYGHAELVELLLKRGAHVNQVQHTVINQSMHYTYSTTSQASYHVDISLMSCDSQLFSLYRELPLHCMQPVKRVELI